MLKRILIIVAVLVVLAGAAYGGYYFWQQQSNAASLSNYQTASVGRGSLTATVGATGTVRSSHLVFKEYVLDVSYRDQAGVTHRHDCEFDSMFGSSGMSSFD